MGGAYFKEWRGPISQRRASSQVFSLSELRPSAKELGCLRNLLVGGSEVASFPDVNLLVRFTT